MNFIKKYILYLLFFLIIPVVVLEILSFSIVKILSEDEVNTHLRFHVENFHPLFKKNIEINGNPVPPHERRDESNPFIFDSRMGYANKPNGNYGLKLPIDDNGFICGEKCEKLRYQKDKDEIRFFILGGSTVAGGHSDIGPLETISSHLKKMMSDKGFLSKKRSKLLTPEWGDIFLHKNYHF